jgi:ubiquinone/menaquinone biosynthesis C-methylase UbiE
MNESPDFPWTFDQYQRYAVLKAGLDCFFQNKSPVVLDVGGISPGKNGETAWIPVKKIFSGQAYVLDPVYFKGEGFIQGDGAGLPFKDNRFDVVSALDVMEHIPPERRETVLKEMGRVSRDMILISAPMAGEHVEKAEEILSRQIKRLYGVVHTQLEEHKRYGLPDKETVSEVLKAQGFSGSDFAYGSLISWLFFQSIKHCFLFQPEMKQADEVLDRFAAEYLKEEEFTPPYMRRFWIASKSRDERELEAGVSRIKEELKERAQKDSKKDLERLEGFSRELTEVFFKEKVAVLIAAESGGENLRACIQNALKQNFRELRVWVWNLTRNPDITYMMKLFFPDIHYVQCKEKNHQTFREQMLEMFCRVDSEYILLLDESAAFPPDAAGRYLKEIKETRKILTGEKNCLMMRKTVFSGRNWNEKVMRKKFSKMKKKEIFTALSEELED